MVPRLLQKLYDAITKKVEDGGCVTQMMFNLALDAKMLFHNQDGTVKNLFWDAIVFKKMIAALGGNVKAMVTGAAPIDGELLKKLKCFFANNIIEGYGMTETSAVSFSTSWNEKDAANVG